MAALALVLPTTAVLAGAAAVGSDLTLLTAGAALALLGGAVGALIAKIHRATAPAIVPEASDNELNAALWWVFPFVGLLGGALWTIGGRIVTTLPVDAELRYALDSLPDTAPLLVSMATILSGVLLMLPPSAAEEHGVRLGARRPLVRGRTILAGAAVVTMAIGSTKVFARNPFVSQDPGTAAKLLPILEQQARRHPTHEPTQFRLGSTYLTLGQSAKAIAALRRAVELDPNDGWAQNSLGWVLGRTSRKDEGLPHLRDAVRLLPDEEWPGRNLAQLLYEMRDPTAAERLLREMSVRWPNNVELAALAGFMHFEDGARDEGAAQVQRAYSKDSSNVIVHLMMAKVLTTRARLPEAIPHFRAYLAAYPNDVQVLSQYASVCMLNGDDAVALKTIDTIETLAPGVVDQYPPLRTVRETARARLAAIR